MGWIDVPVIILSVAALPFLWLFQFVIYILHWLISPFLYIAYFLKAICMLPVHFLAQFEALWYFLGCAVLIGGITGTILYGMLRMFVLVLDLDRKPIPKPIPAIGHDAASYRAAREEKKQKEQIKKERQALRAKLLASQPLIQEVVREAKSRPIALTSPVSPNTGTAATRSGLFQDIILEQTDESDESY